MLSARIHASNPITISLNLCQLKFLLEIRRVCSITWLSTSVVECKTALQIPVTSVKWTSGKAKYLTINYRKFTHTHPTITEHKQTHCYLTGSRSFSTKFGQFPSYIVLSPFQVPFTISQRQTPSL